MPPVFHGNNYLKCVALSALLLPALAWCQASSQSASSQPAGGQLRVANRASASLFQGQQGKQKTEIHYDPATGLVTLKLLVQDSQGYFIPGIRRENFAVYDDGVRQTNATVDIEHAAVTLGLLLEYGGHQPALTRDLVQEISRAGRQLLDVLGRDDEIGVWAYGDSVRQLAGFTRNRQPLVDLFFNLKPPEVSETNLYDALVFTLDRMKPVNRRKAIILLSSGIDTFSKASFNDARSAAENSDTPIYAVSLAPVLRQEVDILGARNTLARINWQDVNDKLQAIVKASGGRLYSPTGTLDLSPTYDDILENLRVRYVITYKPSSPVGAKPHTVRVELVNPQTGKPLEIVDANGRPIAANVILEQTWTAAR
jgi:VWFA-related protein